MSTAHLDGFLELEDLPRENTSVPEGMGDETAEHMLEAGQEYAALQLHVSTSRMSSDVPDDYVDILREFANGKSAAIHLFSSIFFLGVSQGLMNREDPSNWMRHNALHARMLSKRHMMEAVQHMPTDKRIQLHFEHRALSLEQIHWWNNWLAAMATARIVEGFANAGLTIFTPTAKDTTPLSVGMSYGQIDLLAKFPHSARGMVIRVSAKKSDEIDLFPAVTSGAMNSPRFKSLMLGTRIVESRNGPQWIPLEARIGFKVGHPGDLKMLDLQQAELVRQLKIIDKNYRVLYSEFQNARNACS